MSGWQQDMKPMNRKPVQGKDSLCKPRSKSLSSTRHGLQSANRLHTWHPRIDFGTRQHMLISKLPAHQPPSCCQTHPRQPLPIRKVTAAKYANKPWQGRLESLAGPSLGTGLEVVSGIQVACLSLIEENGLLVRAQEEN